MKKNEAFGLFCLGFLALGLFVYILSIGAGLIIPFIIAVLVSFLLITMSGFYKKYLFLPSYLSFPLALVTFGCIIYIIAIIINSNIDLIIKLAPVYQEKLLRITESYTAQYNIETNLLGEKIFSYISFSDIFSTLTNVITSFVKSAGIIFFFTLFILLESGVFYKKLALITGGETSTFFQALKQIQDDIKSYFLVKTLVSLATGILSGLVLYFSGVDFFIFWAFVIFLLNYIPSIGSIIAVFFPVVFSLVQFESLPLTLVLLGVLTGIQMLFGNVIEPKLMGNRLNLSPLVILISLLFWGTLWGPMGMLLSIPLMVMINITLSHIESTRFIAVLFSEKGIIKYSTLHKKKEGKFSLKKMKKLLKG